MKTRFTLLLMLSMLFFMLVGCGNSADQENPASDFAYYENDDNGITIDMYIYKDKHVVIPEMIDGKKVTRIDDYAFDQDTDIVSVKMPDSITEIGESAFSGCSSLTTVALSENLESIGSGAFINCGKLTGISLPNTLTRLGNGAFANCTSIKQICIPAALTDWGVNAFAHSGIESIIFEEGLQTVGENAFEDTQIKEIVIPRSVESLSSTAFLYCDSLKAIRFEGDAPEGFTMEAATESISYTPEAIPSFTVYYREDAEGFTSPEWNGFPSEIWAS